jgi:hypothetical protein
MWYFSSTVSDQRFRCSPVIHADVLQDLRGIDIQTMHTVCPNKLETFIFNKPPVEKKLHWIPAYNKNLIVLLAFKVRIILLQT